MHFRNCDLCGNEFKDPRTLLGLNGDHWGSLGLIGLTKNCRAH